MRIVEHRTKLNWAGKLKDFARISWGGDPIRFVVDGVTDNYFYCGVSVVESPVYFVSNKNDLFLDPKKQLIHDDSFRTALIIPTGLGASVGGHAGDAGSTARLLASVCDILITHPNVVNASDINEMTDNTFYVEGHALTKYLSGHIGLQKVRQNRILVVIDGSANSRYIDAAINSVNAACSSYGLDCSDIVILNPSFTMEVGFVTGVGRATGVVENLNDLYVMLHDRRGTYDAIALTSLVKISQSARDHYYSAGGVNPWGGVEAMLTHAISHHFQVPCAHAPMMESTEVAELDYGIIDPRDAAEIVSFTYLQCVLKGLNRAPRLCESGIDVSCLVTPRMCLGLPVLAAHERGIPIIAVNDKLQVETVDCTNYIRAIVVDNYIEAAGVVAALRAGISVKSLRRPLKKVSVSG